MSNKRRVRPIPEYDLNVHYLIPMGDHIEDVELRECEISSIGPTGLRLHPIDEAVYKQFGNYGFYHDRFLQLIQTGWIKVMKNS